MTFGLEVSDGGAAAQFALDGEDAALLAGDEDAAGILRVVTGVSLVGIGPLDRTAGECLGAVNDVEAFAKCISLSRISVLWETIASLPFTKQEALGWARPSDPAKPHLPTTDASIA